MTLASPFRQRRVVAFCVGLVPLALCACDPHGSRGATGKPPPSAAAPSAPVAAAPASVHPGVPPTFADLAAKADSGVVFIMTHEYRMGRVGVGKGSGFICDSQGHILTNNHVIEDASEITVIIGKSREVKARVIGSDSLTDIAVLEVADKNLPYLPLGDSDVTRVGDWVVAIGNPFGLAHTVSAGIVSGKGRTRREVQMPEARGYYDFIQTDASINPGNSGGPLLDMRGRVVGINTAIRISANNIGFAIPINMVKELLPHLLKDGMVHRSALGVSVDSVQARDVARLGLPGPGGALVTVVVPGGPADQAGLRVDDVILAFNGKPVESPERLSWSVSLAGIGSRATLRVRRGSRTFELHAKLTELKVPPSARPPPEDPFDPP